MSKQSNEFLFEEAKQYIPGGVNSPVRAFRAVGLTPRFIDRAKGARIVDAEGNEYIDLVASWGPILLGHADPRILEAVKTAAEKGLTFGAPTEAETTLAKLISDSYPGAEKVRLVSSGTEACMSAIRVARGFTGKEKVIKFRGHYHGHSDGLLVKAGSGLLTESIPDSAGVPKGYAETTLLADWNSEDSVRELFSANDDIAAVICEPVAANMGVVPPREGFPQFLREVTRAHGALLIFDEVITGFRLGLGGAAERFGVTPDLSTFGKVIGGGMPLAAYAGRRDIMDVVAPLGDVYQAGTLSGNPVAVAAGIAQLTALQEDPGLFGALEEKAKVLEEAFYALQKETGEPLRVNREGSLLSAFFTDRPVLSFEDALTCDTDRFAAYFRHMLEQGIYIAPSQFEALFLSDALSTEDLERIEAAIRSFR
ncbi:MAG: glutamate-1-semialdehyde 2,1-aminomutase [Clostridia bacterium]|nr:glutamate-1-semialdehyde 2,1-aminomutase [Clostridia bacterium]